ncbi:valine--tRNA ligase [Candidatus Marinamargulisbacteria bacterium SCGC AG-343-D04]|nr:valine--tRNA ligase [Candidatus Marinamargulisbacteria bacterium SCGC AG-343-D04]
MHEKIDLVMELPKKYKHLDAEEKWRSFWEEHATYAWDSDASRDNTFSVDTPPPTVSGSLHIGHVFSYTHTDAIVRYQRMKGKSIFYPMGWDDNGLPTERRVQNVFGIRCQPDLPYDSNFELNPNHKLKNKDFVPVSRQNFIEACEQLTAEDEKAFETLWKKLGLSVDWNLSYETINDHCRMISQRSFLDCVEQDRVYQLDAPGMWDVDFQTAVAQAEIEDRNKTGAYHHIRFAVEGKDDIVIATTRPELLAACIAVVAHPDDERYQDYFGKTATTPLFHANVPILPAEHADPEKGTGILMICTFGDNDDVMWWKQSKLPLKQIIGRNGCLMPVTFGQAPFESESPEEAQAHYDSLVGFRATKARKLCVEALQAPESSVCKSQTALVGEPEVMEHPVKYYEKGDSPIELIPTRQWFIDILSIKKELLAQGEAIDWHPSFMKTRYQNWVEGLNQDWCMSRQRFFGVPFPVWYKLDENADPLYDTPIFAEAKHCPCDPLTQCPPGYSEDQRNQPHGFIGDPDVMDTWATSSLTPQLMSHWGLNDDRHQSVFPMDIRPQSHEIIRTWAFYTIVKAYIHEKKIPWNNVVISGWVLDPDRKKMSKSKGNVVTPEHLLDQYSSDAIRYWACKARLGADTAFEESMFAIGQKCITKLFNASKFVCMQISEYDDLTTADIIEPVDQDLMETYRKLMTRVEDCYESFDYAAALEATETAFWMFCDHYLELVKTRAYKEEDVSKRRSALASLRYSLSLFCRLFAPVFPYITEEIWSWIFSQSSASIHKASWPTHSELDAVPVADSPAILENAITVLSDIRAAKTQAQKNMKFPVSQLTIECSESVSESLKKVQSDLERAGSIEEFVIKTSESQDVLLANVVLAD